MANRENPKHLFLDIDDILCKDRNVPCDDTTYFNPNRYDGVHFNDESKAAFIFEKMLIKVKETLSIWIIR